MRDWIICLFCLITWIVAIETIKHREGYYFENKIDYKYDLELEEENCNIKEYDCRQNKRIDI